MKIGEDFVHGTTGSCDTYENEPLCPTEKDMSFKIIDVEVWTFTNCKNEIEFLNKLVFKKK